MTVALADDRGDIRAPEWKKTGGKGTSLKGHLEGEKKKLQEA